jgi:hypothetical protein
MPIPHDPVSNRFNSNASYTMPSRHAVAKMLRHMVHALLVPCCTHRQYSLGNNPRPRLKPGHAELGPLLPGEPSRLTIEQQRESASASAMSAKLTHRANEGGRELRAP